MKPCGGKRLVNIIILAATVKTVLDVKVMKRNRKQTRNSKKIKATINLIKDRRVVFFL